MNNRQTKKDWLDERLLKLFSRYLDSYDSVFDAGTDIDHCSKTILSHFSSLDFDQFKAAIEKNWNKIEEQVHTSFSETGYAPQDLKLDSIISNTDELEPIAYNRPIVEQLARNGIYICMDDWSLLYNHRYDTYDDFIVAKNSQCIAQAFAATGISAKELTENMETFNNYMRDPRPENVKTFDTLINGLVAQYERKNTAYGNSFAQSVERYGKVAALTRMSDKWNRLENLMLNNDIEVGDESVTDTLLDLATYCVMTVMALNDAENLQQITNKLEGTNNTEN